jgi:hypothetical protein
MMCYVELMRDGRVINSFPCKTIPEAKTVAVSMKALIPDSHYLRIVKEVEP